MSSPSVGTAKLWRTVYLVAYTDASLYAVGCCLTQTDELGNEHPIAYGSHKLTPTQSNWSTIEREAFTILWFLNRFYDVIFGAHVVVKCDHDPLKYLLQNTTQNKMGPLNPTI